LITACCQAKQNEGYYAEKSSHVLQNYAKEAL